MLRLKNTAGKIMENHSFILIMKLRRICPARAHMISTAHAYYAFPSSYRGKAFHGHFLGVFSD